MVKERPYHSEDKDLDAILDAHWGKQGDASCSCSSDVDECLFVPMTLRDKVKVSSGRRVNYVPVKYEVNVKTICLPAGKHYVAIMTRDGIETYEDAGIDGQFGDALYSTIPDLYIFKGKRLDAADAKKDQLAQINKGYADTRKQIRRLLKK